MGNEIKKNISLAFRNLEKSPDFKVWNFSSNRQLGQGMKDYFDFVVIGKNALWNIELKIGKDKYSPGQIDTANRFRKLERATKRIKYCLIDENNYLEVRDLILEVG